MFALEDTCELFEFSMIDKMNIWIQIYPKPDDDSHRIMPGDTI